MHLGAFMRPIAIHTGAWRYPGAWPDANFNLDHMRRLIRTLEEAKFDAFFMADHLAVLNMPPDVLKRSHTVTSFEPLTLLSALAMETNRIGLVATATTTYDEPYHVARRFASLDHISKGRAGWNVVTTGYPETSFNFGSDQHLQHATRYARAREFYDVVAGLWDSWADDAFTRDVESGVFFDPDKLHVLGHKGEHFSVRGPLNIARPVQGQPVIFQAGGSEAGRQLAAETAEAIFSIASNLSEGKAFYADVKGRMSPVGRDPEHLKVLPAVFVVVGDTVEEAQSKRAHLDSLVHYDSGIRSLSIMLDFDVSGFDPDGPLPEIPEGNAVKANRDQMIAYAHETGATIRDLAAKAGSYAGLAFVGTATTIADEMEAWIEGRGADGFMIQFSWLPGGLDDFTGKVVPELQRRGRFRSEYKGTTLRDHLGLPRPANRFFGNDLVLRAPRIASTPSGEDKL
jgi:alkanesulfonate monooxygenase